MFLPFCPVTTYLSSLYLQHAIIIQRVDEREQTLTAEIKRWHSETVSAFAERRDQLEAIRKDAEGAFREHKDSVAASAASFRFGIVLKKK